MNIITKRSVMVDNQKVFFDDIVSIVLSDKSASMFANNGEMLSINDKKMVAKLKDRLGEKPNFVYFENRYINADLVQSIKLDVKMANKIFDVIVDFGGRVERFSADNEPSAELKSKEIKKLVKNNITKSVGLSK